jgi:hypothetical protein
VLVGPVVAAAAVPPSFSGYPLIKYQTGSATAPAANGYFTQFTSIFPSPPIVFSNIYTGGSPQVTPPSTPSTINIPIGGWGPYFPPLVPPIPVPAWTKVQSKSQTTGGATSQAVSFTSAIGNGNIVLGAVMFDTNAFPINITDDKGNAYTVVNNGRTPAGAVNTVAGFRSIAPITNGAKTLTFTYQTTGLVWIVMDEFNPGVALTGISLDGSQLLINSALQTTPVFQNLQVNTLQYCAVFGTATVTPGSGWTVAQGGGASQMSEWKQVAAASNANAGTFACAGTVWATAFAIAPFTRNSWEPRQSQLQRTVVNATSGSISFLKPVASGSIVIGTVAVGTNGHVSDITGITDDKGNNYTLVPGYINANGRAMFWSNGVLTNGPTTITCTCSITETVIYFLATEFLPPTGTVNFALDGTPVMTQPGASPFNSGTVTTTVNGDLLYSEADLTGASTLPSNGFSTLNGQSMTWADAYRIQPTAGAAVAQWTSPSGGSNTVGLAAFKASASLLLAADEAETAIALEKPSNIEPRTTRRHRTRHSASV